MYKRTQNNLYLDPTQGRARLYYGPVLNIPFPNNETFRKSVLFHGAPLWNNVTPVKRNIPMFDCFKSMLTRNVVVTTENGFPFIPVGALSMWG